MTVWLVLAAVVPALLVPAGLSLSARVRAARDPAWFCCRVGRPPRDLRGPSWRHPVPRRRDAQVHWNRGLTRARWVDHVLLVRTGALRLDTLAVAVSLPPDTTLGTDPEGRVRRLGPLPQILRLTDGDGRALHLAVAHWDRTRLVGPFLAAAIPGLPAAPPERRPRRRS